MSCTVSVTIYEHPANVSVIAPDQVVLTCQADGEPAPDIVWIKYLGNGSSVEVNTSTGNIDIAERVDGSNRTSILTIQPTSALDAADYTCRVQNEVIVDGILSTPARVTVYGEFN